MVLAARNNAVNLAENCTKTMITIGEKENPHMIFLGCQYSSGEKCNGCRFHFFGKPKESTAG